MIPNYQLAVDLGEEDGDYSCVIISRQDGNKVYVENISLIPVNKIMKDKVKLVEINSLDQLEVDSILVRDDEKKASVGFKAGKLVWLLWGNGLNLDEYVESAYTLYSLEKNGWKLQVEDKPWQPGRGEAYWYIENEGEAQMSFWGNDRYDRGRQNAFGVFKTEAEALTQFNRIKELLKQDK